MKLLFLFERRKYVEHLVFFFHVHTFFFLTLTATFLMARAAAVVPWLGVPAAIFGWTAWLYFLVYPYVAMRHVYRQGYLLTTVKYAMLGFSYLAAFLVAVMGLSSPCWLPARVSAIAVPPVLRCRPALRCLRARPCPTTT